MGFAVSASFTERGILARKQQRLAQQIAAPVIQRIVEAQKPAPPPKVDRDEMISRWFKEANLAASAELPPMSAKAIMEEIAALHGFTLAELCGHRRFAPVANARHHAIYEVARQCQHLSISKIAGLFNRDHTTALNSIKAWPDKAAALGYPLISIEKGH